MITQPQTPVNAQPVTSGGASTPGAGREGASRPAARRDELPSKLTEMPAERFGFDQARHLLLRAGFGGTPDQVETVAAWGMARAVDHLLDPAAVPFEDASTFDRNILRPPTAQERQAYRMAQRDRDEDALARLRAQQQNAEREDRRQMRDVQLWWLKRMIESPRPLEEKATLLWHGHFATSFRKVENSYHMFLQNQMLRRHALGSFAELLKGIVRDPAMISYLDNQLSSVRQPNENLARELMELFSLGVGNYTERDIKEGARALTGYTFEDDEFVLNRENHDAGSKTILGKQGTWDGDDFVRLILAHGATPRFIARKLYCHFVADVPEVWDQIRPDQRRFIEDLGRTLGRNNYAIGPTLRELFMSEHFYADGVTSQKIKSPVELVVGAVRTLRTPVRDLSVLLDALDLMGQSPFYPPSVKGWTGGRSWINTSTMFVRQNTLNFLLTGKLPTGYDALATEQKFDSSHLLGPLERMDPAALSDPDRIVEYMLRFLLGNSPEHAASTLREFIAGLTQGGRIKPDVITGAVLLVSAMPEYQLC